VQGPCGNNPCAGNPGGPGPALPDWAPASTGSSAAFWTDPRVTADPLGVLNIQTSELRPGTSVTGELRSEPRPLPPAVVDELGNATLSTQVPADLEPGWHELHLRATGLDGTSLHAVVPLLAPGPAGDRDGDGVPDDADRCPALPGGQDDRTDSDGDGIGDPCDGETPDVFPPDTAITSGPSGAIGTTSATFAFTSTETGSTFRCRLDVDGKVGLYAPCASPKTHTGLTAGSYKLYVQAIDTAGNRDATPASRAFSVLSG
jgi:hypothetical protein